MYLSSHLMQPDRPARSSVQIQKWMDFLVQLVCVEGFHRRKIAEELDHQPADGAGIRHLLASDIDGDLPVDAAIAFFKLVPCIAEPEMKLLEVLLGAVVGEPPL